MDVEKNNELKSYDEKNSTFLWQMKMQIRKFKMK